MQKIRCEQCNSDINLIQINGDNIYICENCHNKPKWIKLLSKKDLPEEDAIECFFVIKETNLVEIGWFKLVFDMPEFWNLEESFQPEEVSYYQIFKRPKSPLTKNFKKVGILQRVENAKNKLL
jgi:hypothetical protein